MICRSSQGSITYKVTRVHLLGDSCVYYGDIVLVVSRLTKFASTSDRITRSSNTAYQLTNEGIDFLCREGHWVGGKITKSMVQVDIVPHDYGRF